MSDFAQWFSHFSGTGSAPHPWQQSLAACASPRSRFIRIPTGMGKTLGVLAAWAWHRIERADDAWPRRLVWCLPMRVLVEQTEVSVREALSRIGRLWEPSQPHTDKVGVHLLMGGADPAGEWTLHPEQPAVLIGTQDMLLSRALNRGYASGRARWPLEFGLLSHDALWVMDEVQLMDVGLATSGQLQAFHDADAPKGLRPRLTWWMSATLQPGWLETVDTKPHHSGWCEEPVVPSAAERTAGLGAIRKTLTLDAIAADDHERFAERVLDAHAHLEDGDYGRITLVVCNTVNRALATFDALKRRSEAAQIPIELVHSRFRAAERRDWRERFLNRAACRAGVERIIVATQVVEAGVDVTAGCVVTELAPWPSLVQRFGRCARYGGTGQVLVIDRGQDEKVALPYRVDELAAARKALQRIGPKGDVGTGSLEAFEDALDPDSRSRLYPYAPNHLLIRREFDELFDTTPDLTGADLDISRFIRSGDERDLQVFWLDVEEAKARGETKSSPSPGRRPHREELCAVPFLAARDWLCGRETREKPKPRLLTRMRAWVWDFLEGEWVVADRAMLTPGRVVCVASDSGGYDPRRGFDPTSTTYVAEVPTTPVPIQLEAQLLSDESQDADALSVSEGWKTIATHASEVEEMVAVVTRGVGLPDDLRALLRLAAKWHDLGKSHPAFQGGIRHDGRPERQDLAKAPADAWPRGRQVWRTSDDRDRRPGLRHELASALALFAVLHKNDPRHPALVGPWLEALESAGTSVADSSERSDPTPCEREVLDCSPDAFDLLVYLVASHHGKVRVALHAAPRDQDYHEPNDGRGFPIRGVREGDRLPSVRLTPEGPPLPELELTLEPAMLGLSPITGRSWRERTLDLLERWGPGALAWLEALLIAADRRASQLTTSDPLLHVANDREAS